MPDDWVKNNTRLIFLHAITHHFTDPVQLVRLAQNPFQSSSNMLNKVRLSITLLRMPHTGIPRPSLTLEDRVPRNWVIRLHTQVLRCDFIDVRFLQFGQYGIPWVLARIGPVRVPFIRSVLSRREVDGGRMRNVLYSDNIRTNIAR